MERLNKVPIGNSFKTKTVHTTSYGNNSWNKKNSNKNKNDTTQF